MMHRTDASQSPIFWICHSRQTPTRVHCPIIRLRRNWLKGLMKVSVMVQVDCENDDAQLTLTKRPSDARGWGGIQFPGDYLKRK